jgi:hypothetical protein
MEVCMIVRPTGGRVPAIIGAILFFAGGVVAALQGEPFLVTQFPPACWILFCGFGAGGFYYFVR